jgi:ribosomal protein S27AE
MHKQVKSPMQLFYDEYTAVVDGVTYYKNYCPKCGQVMWATTNRQKRCGNCAAHKTDAPWARVMECGWCRNEKAINGPCECGFAGPEQLFGRARGIIETRIDVSVFVHTDSASRYAWACNEGVFKDDPRFQYQGESDVE